MFYELVCGTAPFFGSVEDVLRSHIEAVPIPVREYNREVPEKLADFISKCMAKDPDDRPEDWAHVARFLSTWKNEESENNTPAKENAGKRSIFRIVIIILLSLLVIAELWYILFL